MQLAIRVATEQQRERMLSTVAQSAFLRFSTDDLPERERAEAVRTNPLSLVAWEALPGAHVRLHYTRRQLPGLSLMMAAADGVRYERTNRHLADGNADLVLQVNLSGGASLYGRGRELILHPGDATLTTYAEPKAMLRMHRGFALRLPRAALAPLVPNIDDALWRLIPGRTGALKLLVSYLGVLGDDEALATPELRRLVVTQVHDIAALAIGATRDAAEVAEGGGVRAARLRAVKSDIIANLGDCALTIAAVAQRQRATTRYIHKLFESEGITYSEFVLGQRLLRGHRTLSDPRFAGRPVSTIAFESGFGDLSYFNHAFRRRYGATPSEVRRQARHEA
jgi:AraC-like DNA-binding protein